jgi:urease accessory protein
MTAQLYALLQIADSLFPSGAFAHSYGLEGLLQHGDPMDGAAIQAMVAEIWTAHYLRSDGLLGLHAHRAMAAGDLGQVCDADRRLHAMKLARELREASRSTGRSFLAEASGVFPSPHLAALRALVEAGTSPGHHAIVFQATAAALGVHEHESCIAWGYQVIAQMVAALLRLGVLGHRAATSVIATLQHSVEDGIRSVRELEVTDVASFAPRLEIASMRHERQYSRLFRS